MNSIVIISSLIDGFWRRREAAVSGFEEEVEKGNRIMETQQSLRMRFSFRNATIVICSFNVIAALFLLHSFFSSSVSSRSPQYGIQSNSGTRSLSPAPPDLRISCRWFGDYCREKKWVRLLRGIRGYPLILVVLRTSNSDWILKIFINWTEME